MQALFWIFLDIFLNVCLRVWQELYYTILFYIGQVFWLEFLE